MQKPGQRSRTHEAFGLITLLLSLIAVSALLLAEDARAQNSLLSYRGEIRSGTNGFNGTARFKFALITATNTIIWSNAQLDTNAVPLTGVQTTVAAGQFSVCLGDTNLPNMNALPTEVFSQPRLHLRLWFDDGTNGSMVMSPDQTLTSIPKAAVADGLTSPLPASQIKGVITADSIPVLDASKVGSGTLLPSQIPELSASKITGTLPETLLPTTVLVREERVIVVDGDSITDGDQWLRYFTNLTWFTSGNTVLLTNYATGSDGVGFGHPDELHSEGMIQISKIMVDNTGFATAICSNIDLTKSRLPQKKVVIDSTSNPELCGFYAISSPEMVSSNTVFTFQTALTERVILDGRLERGALSRNYAVGKRPPFVD